MVFQGQVNKSKRNVNNNSAYQIQQRTDRQMGRHKDQLNILFLGRA